MATYKVQPLDENGKLPKAVLPTLAATDVGADPAGAAQAALDGAATALTAHAVDQTAVHGIADTAQLETLTGAAAKAATAQANAVNAAATDAAGKITAHTNATDPHGDRAAAAAALASHEADTTAVHGIANTALLETTSGAQTKANTAQSNAVAAATAAAATDAASKVTTHTNATDPHGDRAFSIQRANHTGTQAVSTVIGLQGILDGKVETTDPRLTPAGVVSAHAGTHAAGQSDAVTLSQAQVAGLVAALAAKADLTGVGGVIPSSQLPPFLINNITAVANQTAMLALPGPRGALAARTDFSPVQLYILTSDTPSTLADWKQIGLAGAVVSVNGQTGAVVLSAADVGAVPTSRTITTTGALSGGGALSGNITLNVPNATAAVLGALQLAGDLTGSATAPTIAAGVIGTAKLADAAVTTAKQADASVTTVKLTDAAVTTVKLADGSVTGAKIVSVPASKVTGLGTAATLNVGVTGGVASYDDTRFAAGAGGGLLASNNLSELTGTAAVARGNIGLGTAATKDTGVTSSTVALGDAPAAAQAAAIAASVPRGAQMVDVKLQYGVVANGTTDDTAAWQAAAAAATAGTVLYLSSGNSIIKAPIVLKTGVRLMGAKSTWYGTQVTHGSSITVGSGFTGLAAIIVNDGTVGSGFSQLVNDVQVHSITLYGADLTGASAAPIHGILMQGNVQDFYANDVMVSHFSGTGIYGLTKIINSVNYKVISLRFKAVSVFYSGQSGWDLETTDSWFTDCMGFNSGQDGWKIRHFNNSRQVNCTAEHNSGRGWNLVDNPGVRGNWMFTGCSSDQNNLDGFYVGVINGWGQIQINSCSFRRDGNNNNAGGGNYAGIQIAGTKLPVVISGTGVTPYLGDNGTAYGPQVGMRIRNATYVTVDAGVIHGFSVAIDWDGAGIFRRGVTVATAAGPSATPTWDYTNPVEVSALKLAGTDLATSLVTTPATTKTASYTLALVDAGTTVEMNTAAASTVTVPLASTVAFPLGTRIEILQYGAGQVTITPAAGATILTPTSLSTLAQYSRIFLRKRATNEWVLSGDLAATTGGGGGGGGGTDPGTPSVGTPTTTSYTTSSEIYSAPERGFFQYTETHYSGGNGSNFTPLNATMLQNTRTSLGRSLVFRYYVMEDMLNLDTIPQDWLNKLAADCAAVRTAGCKMVPRFVYNNSGDYSQITEPAPARLLGHINQIATVLNANKEIIHAVQMGFVGMWGEQYYSKTVGGGTQYGDQGNVDGVTNGTGNGTQKTNRVNVITRLLQQLDPSIYVQLRYVGMIRWAATAGLDMTRIGFHNDAVGSAFGDFGTYSTFNDQSEVDARSYLAAFISQGRPHGGESASTNPPSTDYPAMSAQFAAQRWSYLNPEYVGEVLAGWGQTNRDEVSRRLGYRLRLISATMPDTATPAATFTVSLQIANDGWGRVLGSQARPMRVVFVNGTAVVTRTLAYDLRALAPGATATVSETIAAPTAGSWTVHLWMPDSATVLQDLPAYSVQLGNTGVWNATTGRNSLNRTLTVATTTGGGGGGGTDPGGTPATVTYTASQALIGRPEAGFFTYTEGRASNFQALDAAALQGARVSDQRTIVFRYYILDTFLNTDTISTTFLNALAADLQTAKTAGVKLVARFCYNTSGDYATVTEPAPARIFTHIDQLAAVVNAPAAAGVVHALQMGFIGMWGEQYYSNTVGGGSQYGAVGTAPNPGLVDGVSDGSGTGPQKTNRINVLTKIVNTFNASIPILVRYVGIMHWAEQAGLPMSRIGFHNDAVGSPDGDYGTYSTYNTAESEAAARAYLISKIPGKPHGGESASVNPPNTLYPAMSAQFAAQQWSFLNPIFHFDVLSSWTQDNRDEVNRKLGCRLRLTTATLPTTAATSATVSVSLTLANDGWGKMLVARPLQIRFVNGATTVTRTLAFDVRTIAPGATVTVTESVAAPPTAGSWAMHLAMPDPTAQLAGIPAYAIQLANTGLWDAATGRNALNNTLTVSTGTGGGGGGTSFVVDSSAPPSSGTQVTVDFRATTYALDKWSVGATISTYGTPQGSNINASSSWRAALGALGPLAWRIPIRWAGGNPGSSAGGANTTGDAVTYINNIRSIGGTPYIAIGGTNADNGFTNTEVSGLVNFFNGNNGAAAGGKVERWILGNEPENAGTASIDAYIAALPGWINAAKTADPTVLVSAPAAAYWDTATIQRAINASTQIDILSYHAYDGANTDGSGFPQTAQYRQHIVDLRAMKAGLKYGLEEVNWKAFYQNLGDFYTWKNTCFLASVIGQSLSAGGHAYQYSDSNGALGLMNDGAGNDNQPGAILTKFPAYWALGMWTGMNGTFRRYGTNMVTATWTAQPNVGGVATLDCFPSDNGKIMLVNKSDTTASTITIGLGGAPTGTYVTWATDPNAPTAAPTQAGNGTYSANKVTVTVPAKTVMSLELLTS